MKDKTRPVISVAGVLYNFLQGGAITFQCEIQCQCQCRYNDIQCKLIHTYIMIKITVQRIFKYLHLGFWISVLGLGFPGHSPCVHIYTTGYKNGFPGSVPVYVEYVQR